MSDEHKQYGGWLEGFKTWTEVLAHIADVVPWDDPRGDFTLRVRYTEGNSEIGAKDYTAWKVTRRNSDV